MNLTNKWRLLGYFLSNFYRLVLLLVLAVFASLRPGARESSREPLAFNVRIKLLQVLQILIRFFKLSGDILSNVCGIPLRLARSYHVKGYDYEVICMSSVEHLVH